MRVHTKGSVTSCCRTKKLISFDTAKDDPEKLFRIEILNKFKLMKMTKTNKTKKEEEDEHESPIETNSFTNMNKLK